MTTMLRANFRGYDPTLAEDVWTIRGLFQVDDTGKIEVRDQGIIDVDVDWETAGETGRPVSSIVRNTVELGGWANAIKGYMDCDGGGGSTGLLSGINGEIRLPDDVGRGAYFCLEGEMVFQASSVISHVGHGISAGLLYLAASGDGIDEFDDYGVFMNLGGLTPGATHLLSEDFHTLKCTEVVAGVHYAKYLVQSIEENMVSHSFAALDPNGRMAKFYGIADAPANPDTQGFFDIKLSITGVATDAGAWVAVIKLAPDGAACIMGPQYFSPLHLVVDTTGGPDITGGYFHMQKDSFITNGAPAHLSLVELNFNQTITAMYNVNNFATGLGYVAGGVSTVIGSVPFMSTGGGGCAGWIAIYDTEFS